ncbi:DNA/RNA nuclease SfsA [Amaricoccus tamworthensis]|uniref:DNA/RNA nuclease SfsA n=1 Tax=Amaricoccus tamworthensis TaxID=57002 RepID=UPI003C7CC864
MKFEAPLVRGQLLRRYKRFLADVLLEDGTEITAHCANPGAMLGLNAFGSTVWLEPSNNLKRKLKWSWRLVELDGGHMAGIDTSLPNRVTGEALTSGVVPELAAYAQWRAEVKYGANSRIDWLGRGDGLPDVYVEIKNVHLRREPGLAEFPDCVTLRGAKHLRELSDMVAEGHRAVMLFLVQRTDCDRFRLAADLDPGYAAAFAEARAAGVEALVFDTVITTSGVEFGRAIPMEHP